MAPFTSFTDRCVIASPNPVPSPSHLVVTYVSKSFSTTSAGIPPPSSEIEIKIKGAVVESLSIDETFDGTIGKLGEIQWLIDLAGGNLDGMGVRRALQSVDRQIKQALNEIRPVDNDRAIRL
jgi:hypothetical protein